MKFRLDRKKSAQSREMTPWETYQSRAAQRRKQENKPKWFRRVRRIGDKLPRLRQQRNRQLFRRLSLIFTVFLGLFLSMVYLVSPLSHVQTVSITGRQQLSVKQVQTAVQIHRGDSIFAVIGHEQKVAEQAVARNTRIKHAQVTLVKPNRVSVAITEYATAGYVMRHGDYYEVLENGVVSQQSVTQPKSGTPVYGDFKSTQRLHQMILQYAQLAPAIKRNISEIHDDTSKAHPQRIHLFMNDGNEVYASLPTFAKKMAYYPGIANKMKQSGIVNLEVGAYSTTFKK